MNKQMKPSLGSTVNEVLDAFRAAHDKTLAPTYVEARAIPGKRYRWMLLDPVNGHKITALAVSESDGMLLREALPSEYDELELALAAGAVQIVKVQQSQRLVTLLHAATGEAMPPDHPYTTRASRRLDDREAPGLYALVSRTGPPPPAPAATTSRIVITLHHEDRTPGSPDPLRSLSFDARAAVLAWYEETIGYNPDKDGRAVVGNAPAMIPDDELIDTVAKYLLIDTVAAYRLTAIAIASAP